MLYKSAILIIGHQFWHDYHMTLHAIMRLEVGVSFRQSLHTRTSDAMQVWEQDINGTKLVYMRACCS